MIPLSSTANPIASNPIRLLQIGNTLFFLKFAFSGDCSGGETPVPIPNTAVKPPSANGTARASVWESRSSPGIYFRVRPMSQNMGRLFLGARSRLLELEGAFLGSAGNLGGRPQAPTRRPTLSCCRIGGVGEVGRRVAFKTDQVPPSPGRAGRPT